MGTTRKTYKNSINKDKPSELIFILTEETNKQFKPEIIPDENRTYYEDEILVFDPKDH